MQRQKNIFDRIGALIPGYAGYAERDSRRICDKALRSELAARMNKLEETLTKRMEKALAEKQFGEMKMLEKLRKQLNTLGDKTRYATYGNSSFFADIQIAQGDLEQLYQLDLDLSDLLDSIQNYTHSENWNELETGLSMYDGKLTERNFFLSSKK